MDFSLTEEQELIRDTAQRLLAQHCPASLLRVHADDRAAARPLWDQLRGYSALGGGDCTDLCLFLSELGRVSAPGPFFATTALAIPVVGALGTAAPAGLLDALLSGETTATVAICGADGRWTPNPSSTKYFVVDADIADTVIVINAGWTVRCLAVADVALTSMESADSTRRMFALDVPTVTDDDTEQREPARLDAATARVWLARVYVCAAADLVGTARRLFDMALSYAAERVQFDRPIGSFQAIQHKLAEMSLVLERATAAVQYAAMTVDGPADDATRARAAHSAKAAADTAAQRILKDSIQIHGGVGYTWEHDLQLYLRRATVGATQFGTTSWHHDRIADLLIT